MSDEQTAEGAPAEEKVVTEQEQQPQEEVKAEQADDQETGDVAEQEAETQDESKPKPLSRSQRQQRKIARLSSMLSEQSEELERLRQAGNRPEQQGPPKEEDFNGDYFAYQAAKTAYDVKQELRTELAAARESDNQREVARRAREASSEFLERVDEVKPSVPDYDEVINEFVADGGRFAQHIIEEVRDSDVGPMLAYYLAKNPELVSELNSLPPRDAAREIGRLEARVSMPKPKKQTQAPAPLVQPKGGASAPKDPQKMSMEEYMAWRKGQSAA